MTMTCTASILTSATAKMRLSIDDILADLDRLHPKDQAQAVSQKDEQQQEEHLLNLLTTFEPQHELIQALSHSRSLLLTTDPIDSLHPRIAHIQSALDHRSRNWSAAIQHLSLPLASLPPLSLPHQQSQPRSRSLVGRKRRKARKAARQPLWHDDDSWQTEKLAVQRAISEDHINIPQQQAAAPSLAPPYLESSTSRSSSLSLQPEQSEGGDEDDEEDDAWAFEDSHQGDSRLNSPLPPSSASPIPPSIAILSQPSHEEEEEEEDDAWTFDNDQAAPTSALPEAISSTNAGPHHTETSLSASQSGPELEADQDEHNLEDDTAWTFEDPAPVIQAQAPDTASITAPSVEEVEQPALSSVSVQKDISSAQLQAQEKEKQQQQQQQQQPQGHEALQVADTEADEAEAGEEEAEDAWTFDHDLTRAPPVRMGSDDVVNTGAESSFLTESKVLQDPLSPGPAFRPSPTATAASSVEEAGQVGEQIKTQEVGDDDVDDAWTFDDVVPSQVKDAQHQASLPPEPANVAFPPAQTAPSLAPQGLAGEDEEEDAWDL